MKTLYGKDSKGELRVWSIFTEGADVVVLHGKLGGKITEKRYTAEGKNQGRSNETTPEQQAVLEAEAKYTKQLKSGYFVDKDDALDFQEFTPQKAHDFNKFHSKIKYPVHLSVKLDGARCMIDKNGQAWSKQGEPMELPSHWIGVKEFAVQMGGLDGEIYAGLKNEGGLALQSIISAFRKENENTHKLKFYVYDLPIKGKQSERWLKYGKYLKNPCESIVLVQGCIVHSAEEADAFYENAILQGYEGIVYRNLDGEYEFGKRSYNMLKRKPRYTIEAKVLASSIDRNSWGVLECTLETGVQFKCQMKVDAGDKNYRLYENSLELIGQTIEVEYEDVSIDGVPLKPVGARVRKVDQYGRPVE